MRQDNRGICGLDFVRDLGYLYRLFVSCFVNGGVDLTNRYVQFVGLGIVILFVPLAGAKGASVRAAIELRVQNFTVPPSTGPVGHVLVQNTRDTAYKGQVELKLPVCLPKTSVFC